ncbi:MAG TPA: polyphosphate polymerase domain-containing protein [Chitinophagales bacterium]|nr:polyphosphate polymerase domain-containing protein [Chitinophagales bacterium]
MSHQAVLQDALQAFDSISLKEMDAVELMNRFDTKYVFPVSGLNGLLQNLQPHFRVLEVKGVRRCAYENRYFDTPDRRFFLEHHNGKANRLKIRFRKYVDSDASFFEIKCKTNKGKTIKERVSCTGIPDAIDPMFNEMLFHFMARDTAARLVPTLDNAFTRTTLVGNDLTNRLTIDTGVTFRHNDGSADIRHLVIVELKQEGANVSPLMRDAFHQAGMLPVSVSKYAIGTALLFPHLKQNNFKHKLHFIHKLRHAA